MERGREALRAHRPEVGLVLDTGPTRSVDPCPQASHGDTVGPRTRTTAGPPRPLSRSTR